MLYKHTVVLRTRPVTHFTILVFHLTHLSRFGGAEKEKLTNHMCKISQLAPDSVCLHLWYVKLCVRFSLTRMLLLTDCLKHSDSRVSTMSWTGKEGLMRLNISHNEVMLKKKRRSAARGSVHVIRSATPTPGEANQLWRLSAWHSRGRMHESCKHMKNWLIPLSVWCWESATKEKKSVNLGNIYLLQFFSLNCVIF